MLQDVVGINTSHQGLSVRLLRSATLLGLLHLYRFIFVVGVLQVRTLTLVTLAMSMPRHSPCSPEGMGHACSASKASFVILPMYSTASQAHAYGSLQGPGGSTHMMTARGGRTSLLLHHSTQFSCRRCPSDQCTGRAGCCHGQKSLRCSGHRAGFVE